MSDRYKGAILSPTAPTVTPQSAGGIYTSSQQLQYQGQGVWPTAVNYPINNSLRFRASASAYLNRTPASTGTGTGKTWTWSGWVKRGTIGSSDLISLMYGATSSGASDRGGFGFYTYSGGGTGSDSLTLYYNASFANNLTTTQVFRDPSAWYHIIYAVDTTQATASNRVKLYVNGVQVTAFSASNYPTQNYQFAIGNNVAQWISSEAGTQRFFDGYMAEVNFIDGTQLTPSSFGTTDAYGIWQPIPYTGAYGTNGFYLPFTDNSALTTSSNVGLGKDFSGNGNYWATNNISITAGSTYDSMKDVPTNTNSNTANYATLNPTVPKTYCTQTDGNLKSAGTSSTDSDTSVATIGVSSGKWYWEDKIGTINSAVYPILGAGRNILSSFVGAYPGTASVGGFGLVVGNGNIVREGTTVTTVTALVANDVVGFALDLGALTCAIYKNNSLIYTVTGLTAGTYYPMANEYSSSNSTHNYGQQPFAYTPPSGFYPLNTYNLSTPTILDGDQYFNATTYTGTGTSGQVQTNSGSMQPDLVWIKQRNGTGGQGWWDAVRGATKYISSQNTDAEGTSSVGVTSFNSNGFTVGSDSWTGGNTATYIAWQWRASNAAAVTNTNGSITTTVSANPTAGFSIVTYTGTGSNATIGHGLGVPPKVWFWKNRDAASDWSFNYYFVYNSMRYLFLNTTAAQGDNSSSYWGNAPTSTVNYIGGPDASTNINGQRFVMYAFAEVAGYSSIGSYTGNGSTDGPFIYTGFRPRYLMVKTISNAGYNWNVHDTARNPYNSANLVLYPNTNGGDDAYSAGSGLDILSNGFKIRDAGGGLNGSGFIYIYMAFAENPFKIARAR